MPHRYIVQFDSTKLPRIDTDFLVIGSGYAGLSAAIKANQHGNVLLITKITVKDNNFAHEEIAAIMSQEDTVASYIEDTLKTGSGLCNQTGVELMVEEGIQRFSEIIQGGRTPDKKEDALLVNHVKNQERIRIIEGALAIDFMTQGDRCYGVVALIDGKLHCIFAKATILASGGLGQIYQGAPTPASTTGDGMAAAWRAGCEMTDMEFVQFHPTALFLMEGPYFLITENVCEEGGILINSRGERFMAKYNEMEELAPRDVISRAILSEMELTGNPCVYLDITHLPSDFIQSCFSRIYQFCYQFGVDITTDVIPVRSGVHFMIGGVRTNLSAETNLRGLYACGEVACTSVHGASTLANNPLLECIVFGTRAGKAAVEYAQTIQADSYADLHISSDDHSALSQTASQNIRIEVAKAAIQKMMWQYGGLFRRGEDLEKTAEVLIELNLHCHHHSVDAFELQNMQDVAVLIAEAGILRTESRGTHYREDFPEQDDLKWKKHIILQRGKAAKIVA